MLALEHHQRGAMAEARDLYQAILAAQPDHLPSLNNLAAITAAAGDLLSARGLLQRVLAVAPDRHQERISLLAIVMRLGDSSAVEVLADDLLAADPHCLQALKAKGVFRYQSRRFDEAIPWFQATIETDPSDEETRYYQHRCLLFSGRHDEAHHAGLALLNWRDQATLDYWEQQGYPYPVAQSSPPPFDPSRPERNAIVYCLWGEDPLYILGAIENVQIARKLYPEWRVHIYCAADLRQEVRDSLEREGAKIILMPPPRLPWEGLYWRFLALDDTTLDRVLMRDADSRLNAQEKAAVDAWIASNLPFHILRDLPIHEDVIPAGLWGAARGALPPIMPLVESWLTQPRPKFGDQIFLRMIVWPIARSQALIHDGVYRFGPDPACPAQELPADARRPLPLHHGMTERPGGEVASSAQFTAEEALALALRRHQFGALDEAQAIYDAILKTIPGHRDARLNRATLLAQRGEWSQALTDYTAALSSDSNNAGIWNNVGVLLRNLGQASDARAAFAHAFALDPRLTDAAYNQGMAWLSDDPRAALAAFASALEAEPDHDGAIEGSRQAALAINQNAIALGLGARLLSVRDGHARNAWAQNNQVNALQLTLARWPRSFDGTRPDRNAIIFALPHTDPVLIEQALVQIRRVREIFPGWHARVYCSESLGEADRARFVAEGARLVLVAVDGEPSPFLTSMVLSCARFMASDDPNLDFFLCRDLSPPLESRDATAVQEWLASGLPFHIMRVHPDHADLILPGWWGGAAGLLPPLGAIIRAFLTGTERRAMDGEFLRIMVWPLIAEHTLTHDSFYRFGLNVRDMPAN